MSVQAANIGQFGSAGILDTKQIASGQVVARYSARKEDVSWDSYLSTNPGGRYWQSSMWARAKSANGFQSARVVLQCDDKCLGGFQVLWKRSRLGSWGFIYKGPVLSLENPILADFAVYCICQLAKRLKLNGLVLQPVDASEALCRALKARKFLPNYVATLGITTATLVVDVSQGMEAVEKKMKRSIRQKVRQAKQRGVVIRDGGEEDIPVFFNLMLSTCKRQKTNPNPADVKTLYSIWRAFCRNRSVRLSFAETDGEALSGLFSICFGDQVTFWKRGWSERGTDLHPNELLMFDALEWSHKNGFKICDFGSLSPDIARTLLAGESLSDSQKKSRDFFHLGFGGTPVLLPEGLVLARHPFLRLSYRAAFCTPWLSKFTCRLLMQIRDF